MREREKEREGNPFSFFQREEGREKGREINVGGGTAGRASSRFERQSKGFARSKAPRRRECSWFPHRVKYPHARLGCDRIHLRNPEPTIARVSHGMAIAMTESNIAGRPAGPAALRGEW